MDKPNIGDIIDSGLIGRRPGRKYIWTSCPGCGEERWAGMRRGQAHTPHCVSCGREYQRLTIMGKGNGNRNGGRFIHRSGYAYVKMQPDDFFYPMANSRGYVQEHRLIMAQSINRNLQPWEMVHHKNEVKTDNRLANLQLVDTAGEHSKRHGYQTEVVRRMKRRIEALEAELQSLRPATG